MGILMNALVRMSGYVNLKNVSIIMTYLYLITVIIMVNSSVELAKESVLKKVSLLGYKTRSLTEYEHPVPGDQGMRVQEMRDQGMRAPQKRDVGSVEKSKSKSDQDIHIFKKKNSDVKLGTSSKVQDIEIKKNVNVKPESKLIDKRKTIKTKIVDPKEVVQTKKKDSKALSSDKNKVKKTLPKIAGSNTNAKKQFKHTGRYKDVEIVKNFDFHNELEEREAIWQNITSDGTFLIFSAILEHAQGRPNIRALAMNGNTFLPKFYCELTYGNNGILTIKGRIWMLPDHHEKEYKTVFLYCPLPDDNAPTAVSIITIKNPERLHRLPIINNQRELRNFTVCLSPLFFNYSIEYDLVQWFELNKLIGVDMFHVYNYSTVGRTDEILNHYQRVGWVKVIQWHLPNYTDVHYYGQIAMMNDCFLRNYRISRYMVNIDIDEFIVPRRGRTTWNQLMPSLPGNACEYSFRSTLLTTESNDVYPGKQKARELHLRALLYNSRREYIFNKNVRTKYIVNTTCIDTVGIHYCWRYRNGTANTQRHHVAPREALTFHFRSEPIAREGKEIKEEAVYKYHKELIANAKLRWEKIESERKVSKNKVALKKREKAKL